MSKIANLRVGARLSGAFALVVLGLLAVAAAGWLGLGSVNREVKTLTRHEVAPLAAALEAGRLMKVNHAETIAHLYIDDGDLEAQDATADRIARNAAADDTALAAVRRSVEGPRSKRAFTAFAAAWDAYAAAVKPVLEASRAETVRADDERAGSRDAFLADVVPADAEAGARLDDLRRLLQAGVAGHAAAADASAGTARRTLLIVSLLTVLAAAALAALVTRSLTRPVARLLTTIDDLRRECIAGLRGALEAMAAGDLTRDAPADAPATRIARGDEIGRLAAAVDGIRDDTLASVRRTPAHATRSPR